MDTWIHESAHQYYLESLEEANIKHMCGEVYYGDDGRYFQIILHIPMWESNQILNLVKIGFRRKIKERHCHHCDICHFCLTEGLGGCSLKQYI